MEANLRGSNLGHDLLEMIVDRVRIQILAKLMGEHKVHRILKALTVLKLPGLLLPFDAIKDVHDLLCRLQLSGLSVFCRDKLTPAVPFPGPLELLVDQERSAGKINRVLGQAEDLSLT